MKIDGGCHCGYITYEAEADPEKTTICHCTDCRHLSFRICACPEGADLVSLTAHNCTGSPTWPPFVAWTGSELRRLIRVHGISSAAYRFLRSRIRMHCP